MDGSLWACFFALTAHLALFCIDVGEVVLECDGFKLFAYLYALAAADARCFAGFVGDSTFVFVVAEDDDTTALRTFESDLDDASRAGFCACSAGCAFFFVYFGKTGFGVHVDGIELTLAHAVSATEAAIAAACLAHACHLLYATTLGSVVLCLSRTVLACAVTAHDCYFWGCCFYG